MAVESDLQHSVANVLSTMTIISCLFLKVPQIMSIWRTRSAEGIFVQAMVMEVVGFSIMTLYNFTNDYGMMTYMEYPIILLQVYVMFYLVLKYQNKLEMPIVPIGIITYLLVVFVFITGLLPKVILSYLVPLCTPLSGFAKVTYIYGILDAGNADAVSLTTWIISVATNLAICVPMLGTSPCKLTSLEKTQLWSLFRRFFSICALEAAIDLIITRIFTVFVDSADKSLMANFTISTLLSASVLFTALYYQGKMSPEEPEKRRKSGRRCSHSHHD